MANDKKSSIIKEALTDYNAIKEAAEANAKNKLAEEFPEKFNYLLKEELQNKNKKTKESYKKLDETEESDKDDVESNKESVMKNQKEETKKVTKESAGEGKPFVEKAKGVEQVEETAGEGKPFVEKAKGAKVVDETAGEGKPFVEKAKGVKKVEEDVKITDTVGKGDPFDEKTKKAKKVDETAGEGKPFVEKTKKIEKPLQTEEFDVTGLDVDSVGSALEGAESQDEILTMEEIEEEISKMQGLGEELDATPEKSTGGVPYQELVEMRDKLDGMIKGMGNVEEMQQGKFDTQSINKMHDGNYDSALIDEKNVEEMHSAGATDGAETYGTQQQVAAQHAQGPTDELIDEENPTITDADIEAVLGKREGEVEESQTRTLANQKKVGGGTIPGKEYKQSAVPKMRLALQGESEKKLAGLIEENKKLTKKVNEIKKFKESAGKLMEGYKTALDKYRTQLKEMATFNTNLAHVNNLLVNEELALTQEDKIKIISEFKKVDSIAESQKKYKAILSEMRDSKKTLTESIEEKVSASIQPSSKQKLDEVVEKTAYENDEHIKRMKQLIEYVEKRGKKIIE
jgi:hypothetical protein